jgi:DNA-binding Lrp family transcriptional regulator
MKKSLEERGYDNLDRVILEELQANGRISVADLARKIHLSQPAVHNRIKRLERDGIITNYVALLDREQVGYDLLCFVQIRLSPHTEAVIREVEDCVGHMTQVLEMYATTGGTDMFLKIVVENHHQLNDLVAEFTGLKGIERVETNLVLREIKVTTVLSLDE